MKKLLLLILLISFSHNESKAQDSVTVTFRLNGFYPNGTSVGDSINSGIDFISYSMFGNFQDVNATLLESSEPLSNYNAADIYMNNDTADPTPNNDFTYVKIKFPFSSIGQELNFGFSFIGVSFSDPTFIYEGERNNIYPSGSNYNACFQFSQLTKDMHEASGFFNLNSNFVRTIAIPPIDATYSYCWSSCLQCNGDAPGIISDENILRTRTFVDLNNNSVLDAGEPPIQGINVQVNTNPNPINGFTGNNGRFSTYLPNGNYTVQIASPNQFSASNSNQNITLTDNDTNLLFPLTLAPDYYEVEAVFNPAQMVAGFDQTSSFVIQNTGNSVSNLSLTITLPEDQSFVSSVPAPTNIAGGVLTYLIPSISAYTNFPISINTYLPPPPTFMPGDEITWNLNLSPLPNEESDANNAFSYTLPILSSYDPNDKTMMKGSSITPALVNAGEDFHYRIRFQNTGNFPASFIHVRDTLEAGLNPSSLRMLAASHEYSLTVTDNIYLDWFFPNIQLPDSTSDPEGSQGYILFSIQPVLPVSEGTQIENTAHIYFDFNPAVITNTEVTTIETPSSISSINVAGNVWVNANMELRIQHPMEFNQLNIYSIDGRLLHQTSPSNYFDLKSINTTGMVLIELVGNNKRVVLKQALIR
jgi:uncharacterized repeat protein (TIGR01451 family)